MPTAPRRRWSFSLRTMFVGVTVLAIFCGVAYWVVESGLYGTVRDVITGDWLPDQQ